MASPRVYVSTSVTPEQYHDIVAAVPADMSVSAWVRDLILKALSARPA